MIKKGKWEKNIKYKKDQKKRKSVEEENPKEAVNQTSQSNLRDPNTEDDHPLNGIGNSDCPPLPDLKPRANECSALPQDTKTTFRVYSHNETASKMRQNLSSYLK